MTDGPEPHKKGPGEIAHVVRELGPANVVAGWYFLLPLAGLGLLLWNVKAVAGLLANAGPLEVVGYAAAFAIFSGLAILPTWVQSLIGGFAFGLAIGAPAAVAGVAGGAAIGYEVARLTAGKRVERVVSEHPKWKAVCEALVGRGFWPTLGLVTLVRLPPNSPFAITNLVMGSLRVNRAAHFLGTVLGVMPRTAVAVYLGTGIRELSQESLKQGPPAWLFISGLVLLIIVAAVIGNVAKNALHRAVNNGSAQRAVADKAA